jgi:hypothetical protein
MNNIKFANVQQTKAVYNYKNMKAKLYKTSAAIWFNKICKLGTEPIGMLAYTFVTMTP